MSAPAIKSSMPAVGSTPVTTGHNMLPMNMVAQKVGTQDSTGMKSLSTTNMNCVSHQPTNQALSLIQDHKSSLHQTSFGNSITEQRKEQEQDSNKMIQNGTEQSKIEKVDTAVTAPAAAIPSVVPPAITIPVPPTVGVNVVNAVPNASAISNLTSSSNIPSTPSGPPKSQVEPTKLNNTLTESAASEKNSNADVTQKSKEDVSQQKNDGSGTS